MFASKTKNKINIATKGNKAVCKMLKKDNHTSTAFSNSQDLADCAFVIVSIVVKVLRKKSQG